MNKNKPYIDFDLLARQYGVSKSAIAAVLFKGKYSGQALYRISKPRWQGNIKASQIIALAELLGCRPGDVFAPRRDAYTHTTNAEGIHVFIKENGGVRITLDASTGVTSIFLSDKKVMRTVITDTAIAMDEYLSALDGLIADFRASDLD